MKKFYIILILVFSLLPNYLILAQANAGFVRGDIWYSKDPFEEGDKIQIYTMLFNPDSREFSGTVIFFDNTTFLGKKDFKLASKEANDFAINWTVNAGEHKIYAKIENAKFLISTGKYEEVYISGNQTEESKRSVDKKIITKTNLVDSTIKNNLIDSGTQSIENIGKLIEEKTPNIISTSIISSTNGIEKIRSNIADTAQNSKEEIEKNLDLLRDNKKEGAGKLTKPFNYIKLFFMSIVSLIFSNKIIFYSISVAIVFLILRYLWHLIF